MLNGLTQAQLKALGVPRKARRALLYGHRGAGMPKVDPFTLPRPERPVETREFKLDGVPIELTLRPSDMPDDARAAEVADQLVRDYITGSEEREAAEFPDGIKVSRTLFQICASLAERQCPENPAEAYSVVELVIFSAKRPRDWNQILAWANAQQAAWRTRQGE
jgi:hypothetical protein